MGPFSRKRGNSVDNSPTTNNQDRRMALQDSVAVTEGSTYTNDSQDNSTTIDNSQRADAMVLQTLAGSMPDAVKALASAGADIINRAGGSVVSLNRDSINANTKSFDAVVDFGSGAIDRLIDASIKTTQAGATLAAQAVDSFTPTDNKQADAIKWALIAAAGVAVMVLLKETK